MGKRLRTAAKVKFYKKIVKVWLFRIITLSLSDRYTIGYGYVILI